MAYQGFPKGIPYDHPDLLVGPWNQKVDSSFEIQHPMLQYPIDSFNVPLSPSNSDHLSPNQNLYAYPPDQQMTFLPYGSPPQHYDSPYTNPPTPPYDSSSASSATICDTFIPSSVASPESIILLTPEQHYRDIPVAVQSPFTHDPVYGSHQEAPCVAMESVQGFPDPDDHLDERDNTYSPYPQDPQELVPASSDVPEAIEQDHYPHHPYPPEHAPEIEYDEHIDDDDYESPIAITRRQPKRHRAPPSPTNTRRKITKPNPKRRRTTTTTSKRSKTSTSDPPTTAAYPCPLAPYGCPQSFGAKNEWKRHAYTKHFSLSYWRCDQCPSSPSRRPNDFNRKDLFVQHVRRMHPPAELEAAPAPTKGGRKEAKGRGRGPRAQNNRLNNTDHHPSAEAALNATALRCHIVSREAPQRCACVFCEDTFEGEGCLEARMEHVGRHLEERKKGGLQAMDVRDWKGDAELEEWLVRNEMVVRKRGGVPVLA